MSEQAYQLRGAVIAVVPIAKFSGTVLVSFPDPRFVIAIRVEGSKHGIATDNRAVELAAFDVVFYAVHSVAGLFGRSEVIGETFTLDCSVKTTNGQDWHLLSLA